jgi:membrane-anchored protein YejM (alkaline phosphatase superfamily)
LKTVYCLEDQKEYLFFADSAKNAIEKMLYTLNLSKTDKNAIIEKTKHGYSLQHNNLTYWAKEE